MQETVEKNPILLMIITATCLSCTEKNQIYLDSNSNSACSVSSKICNDFWIKCQAYPLNNRIVCCLCALQQQDKD